MEKPVDAKIVDAQEQPLEACTKCGRVELCDCPIYADEVEGVTFRLVKVN